MFGITKKSSYFNKKWIPKLLRVFKNIMHFQNYSQFLNVCSKGISDLTLSDLLTVRVYHHVRIALSSSGYNCVLRSSRLEVRLLVCSLQFFVYFFPKAEPDKKETNNKTAVLRDN